MSQTIPIWVNWLAGKCPHSHLYFCSDFTSVSTLNIVIINVYPDLGPLVLIKSCIATSPAAAPARCSSALEGVAAGCRYKHLRNVALQLNGLNFFCWCPPITVDRDCVGVVAVAEVPRCNHEVITESGRVSPAHLAV